MEVTGSSPVLPIRENKKWGKEMRMSVCLTQPNNSAVNSDSQRFFYPFEVDVSRTVWYNNV